MSKLRILIADDHDMIRRGLRSTLTERPGWEVCAEAADGAAAVAKARETQPDVAILDISMPKLNGLEAARRLHTALPATGVLILTMHDSDELVRAVLASGARGYLLKADAGNLVVQAVEALHQGRHFFTVKVAEQVLAGFLNPSAHEPADTAHARLSPREREVVQLVAEGRSTKEVAAQLGLSAKTVESHRANLMLKLHLRSVADVVRYAVRNRIIEP
jgi:DNA-binding NarL/FixJ family response regulator